MKSAIDKIKNLRLFLLHQLKDLTPTQLNRTPPGFSNNIIWNIGHLICAQQNMSYVRSHLPVIIEDKYFSPYLPGTKPENYVDEKEIEVIKELFISTIDTLQIDLDKNIFNNYSPSVMIPKVYGFEVLNIESALEYLLWHEGYHQGLISSLRKLVQPRNSLT
jgi:hypothetical protein